MVAQSDGFGYSGQFPSGQYPNPSGHALQIIWDSTLGQYMVCDGITWQALTGPTIQRNTPSGIAPSGFFANNGIFVIGQAPSASATVSFSAVSGTVTMTFSAATLLGTAADVGRILTILDGGVYKYATITVQSSTTVATASLSATLSGTGPFANAAIWLTGSPNTDTSGFGVPFGNIWPGIFLQFPANVIGPVVPTNSYFCVMQSLTVGQAFNNPLPLLCIPGISEPSVPSVLVPFATTGQGAYANLTATMFTEASYLIPGNSLGRYGRMVIKGVNYQDSSSTVKTYQILYGGQAFLVVAPSTNNVHPFQITLANIGVTNIQARDNIQGTDSIVVVAGVGAPSMGSVDSTVDQPLIIQQQLNANAKDWGITVFHTIELFPSF